MDDAQDVVALADRVADDAHAEDVEDLVDLLLAPLDLQVDRIDMLHTTLHGDVRHPGLGALHEDRLLDVLDVGVVFALL